MVKDLVICWGINTDYPLWRAWLRRNRSRFNEVIISFSPAYGGINYREFIKNVMRDDYCLFVNDEATPAGEDWRSHATNRALLHSYNAPYIWFTEQDFFPTDEFWQELDEAPESDYYKVDDKGRLHPCSLLIKREVLNKTKKNFGIVPDISDHFSIIQRDLERMGASYFISSPDKYKHFNGWTSNFYLITQGQAPNYNKDEFDDYLRQSLDCGVACSPQYTSLVESYLKK